MSQLKGERIRLRPWNDEDFEPFARLNADPIVMKHFPGTLTRRESNEMACVLKQEIEVMGWGLWAVEVPEVASFIGFIGLHKVMFDAAFTPAVEIGWRLEKNYWGMGYATEGANIVLDYGFRELGLEEIVSFTAETNKPSERVMQRIGMNRDAEDDFNHPKLPEGHPLRRHILYRIKSNLEPS
jgi:3-dehydroquinate dehydratase/shikimate dehydrogenase